tara:strand:+ start:144 stop:1412 length:1269 start_codon:yes stop_codon:yes gene_type:complete
MASLKKYEHPKGSGITIREKINTKGTTAFGVSYVITLPSKITGTVQTRKQFKDKDEAEKHAAKEWQGFSTQGRVYFKATDEERNEFSNLLPKLRAKGVTLTEAIEFALPRLRPEGGDKSIADVISEMKRDKIIMLANGTLRERTENTFRSIGGKISHHFGEILIRDLSLPKVKEWLEEMDISPRTVKNHLNILSEILHHSQAKKYCSDHILDELTKTDRRKLYGNEDTKTPGILTAEESERLLQAALEHTDLDLLAATTLGLFCGIRTEELKRLKWQDVKLDESLVTIGSEIAKKRRIRNVPLPKNALAWLKLCPKQTGAVTRSAHANDYQKRFRKLLKLAQFTEAYTDDDGKKCERIAWKSNAMRHSFGTYHFALYADSIETSRLLGHKTGDNVLFENYRALATKTTGTAYFAISPPKSIK